MIQLMHCEAHSVDPVSKALGMAEVKWHTGSPQVTKPREVYTSMCNLKIINGKHRSILESHAQFKPCLQLKLFLLYRAFLTAWPALHAGARGEGGGGVPQRNKPA